MTAVLRCPTTTERGDWLRTVLDRALLSTPDGGAARLILKIDAGYRSIPGVPHFVRLLEQAQECDGAWQDAPEFEIARTLAGKIVESYTIISNAEADAQAAGRALYTGVSHG